LSAPTLADVGPSAHKRAMERLSTSPASQPAAEIASRPFEKALEELETIVKRLEQGNVPLEDSISIYERGEALKKHCEALLKRAEARIEKITVGPNGQATGTTPLDAEK
jgi:exodeoxyribonuclease VII small subunit